MLVLVLFYCLPFVAETQYGPQSNIDQVAQRPVLPQCPREWEWACRNGECIARYDVCDGIEQCSDGSDEWQCDQKSELKNAQEGAMKESPVTTTAASTTAKAVSQGYLVISRNELFLAFVFFIVASLVVVYTVKGRARRRNTTIRNRRGNILQQDSDEDEILISSMYAN